MKTHPKDKNTVKNPLQNEKELTKQKKKLQPMDQKNKLNLKSKKFWEDVIDDEGEDIEKYLR